MSIVRFDLKSLEFLDPRVTNAFNRAIAAAVSDCQERPADKSARKISLEMELVPLVDDSDGGCSHAEASFTIKCKVPDRRSRTYSLLVQPRGGLLFNDQAPENADQTTLDELDADGRVRRSKPQED